MNTLLEEANHFKLPRPVYIWLNVWIIVGNALGLFIVGYFSPAKSIDFGQVAIWGLAIFFLGAVIGILFGVPKNVSSPTNSDDFKNVDRALKVDMTNLTEISDWLTKIVLGAGLVQLKEMPAFIWKIAGKMAIGVSATPAYYSKGLCAALIIYHFCLGLLCGYFAMRTIFKEIFDKQARAYKIEEIKAIERHQIEEANSSSQS